MNDRNIALIGAGYWGKNLARNFNQLQALHTLCDLSQATLDSYGADFAEVQKTSSIDSLWSSSAVKRVVIAAPAVHHFKLTRAALLADKDVFVEKPLCLDPKEAEELIALAKERGRILMVGHLLQYHPYVQYLQKLLASGDLGAVYYITSNRLNLGKIRREENALWSFAPHDLSVILSLAGNKLPVYLNCVGGSYLTPGVDDTTLTTMSFSGGLKAHVYVTWLNPFKEQKLTIVCEKGMAVFDDMRPWAEKLALYRNHLTWDARLPIPNKVAPEYVAVPEKEPLRMECQHFIDCCNSRTQPRTDGAEGLRVLRVLQTAQASLERHGQVQIFPAT